ncbi:MAG: hypothetical protein JXQ73_07855 [Phycisphaerae bacterium]|nr:hypothetical protein [Phycisphaerae bacterium]
MPDQQGYRLPTWAPRVSKAKLERLYRGSARGPLDEELIDDVGYALYARCQSMLEVTEILRTGRPKCPECQTILPKRNWQPDEELKCPACHWRCPAKAYNKTYARKNLGTGGLDEEIRRFMRDFESARSPGDKLVLIDTLIHRFHWASTQGRPLATALIEGKMKDIMPFLDRLNYGNSVPPEVTQTRQEWRGKWAGNPWSTTRGQQPNRTAGGDA